MDAFLFALLRPSGHKDGMDGSSRKRPGHDYFNGRRLDGRTQFGAFVSCLPSPAPAFPRKPQRWGRSFGLQIRPKENKVYISCTLPEVMDVSRFSGRLFGT